MPDNLTANQRAYCMSRVKSKNTSPELAVRKIVHSLGYRFRLHVKKLPGAPDIVLPRHRKVVFVNGCYWHRHNCKHGRSTPKTRKQYWGAKFARNCKRDKAAHQKLRQQGWRVLTVWECQTKKPEKLIGRIADFLKKVD